MDPSSSSSNLEREFKQAQQFGRWLSDEERLALEKEASEALKLQEQQRHRRFRLIILTGVCLLIPPLWGLAAGLSFYLLFPDTAKRVALIAGGGVILVTALSILVLGILLFVLVNIIL